MIWPRVNEIVANHVGHPVSVTTPRSAAKPDDRGVSAWSQDQRAEGIFLYADAVGEHRQIAAITPGFGEIIIVDRGRCQTNWIGSEEPANQASQAAS